MPITHAANTKQFEIPTASFISLASPNAGSKETAAWKLILKPMSPGLTHQLTREEIIIATHGSAVAHIGNDVHIFKSGDTIVIPAYVDFSLANPNIEEFSAIAIFPVGGQAVISGGEPFTPPWAE